MLARARQAALVLPGQRQLRRVGLPGRQLRERDRGPLPAHGPVRPRLPRARRRRARLQGGPRGPAMRRLPGTRQYTMHAPWCNNYTRTSSIA